jgi:hypothetical protein
MKKLRGGEAAPQLCFGRKAEKREREKEKIRID